MTDIETYHKLAQRIREVNDKNGWDKPTWENLPAKVMMIMTELDEAYDGWSGYVEGREYANYPEELADVAIRIMDVLEAVWPLWCVRTPKVLGDPYNPVGMLWSVVGPLCKSVEAWRHDEQDDTRTCLELALMHLREVAETSGVTLPAWIDEKIRKNSTRGKLHGKKRSVG